MTTNAAPEKETPAAAVVAKDSGATPEELEKDLKTSTVKGPRGETITFKHRISILYDYEFVSALDIVQRANEPGVRLKDSYDAGVALAMMGLTEWDYKGSGDTVLPINEEVLKKMGIHALIRLVEEIIGSIEVGE